MDGYALLTNNQSLIISNTLIIGESIALEYAKIYQKKTRKLHEQNIPLFCDELLPMSLVSQNVNLTRPSPHNFSFLNFTAEYPHWKNLIKAHSWPELSAQLHHFLKQNNEPSEYNCLTRHFIEALWLFSTKASTHTNMTTDLATQKELNTLTASFMNRMLLLLKLTPLIDQRASTIQKKGVPIICNDIPWVQL